VEWLIHHWRSMKRGADIDRMNHAGHQAIFDAIAARDPDNAEEALRRHLIAAWEFVRSTFAAGHRPVPERSRSKAAS
ncbi:MAG: FCD domain-containing protein, partial [Microvirga sp.]